jgi:hypothetical protein
MNSKTIQAIARRLHNDCFEAHRGAFWWDEKRRVAVAFGNDGRGHRQDFEIAAVRKLLADYGGKELGFAWDEDYSFVLMCELPEVLDPDVLEGVLWNAWNIVSWHKKGDPTPVVLNWDEIRRGLEEKHFASVEGAFTGGQANIAHATLERNGLA